jgi:hypothetical protein
MPATWTVHRTANARFPFRIAIEQNGRVLWAVRARDAWPGPGANVFCLREREADPAEAMTEVERVPVQSMVRVGAKLTVALDRPNRKRCEFLVLTKPLKDGSGTYEQVFFRTESAVRAHRTSGRVELQRAASLDIVIDAAERYAWSFPSATVTRRKLPAGDYALVAGERYLAVVERKSFDNLLSEIAAIKGLHQSLAALAAYARAALVIEANYADFLDPDKIRNWPVQHPPRVLAEIAALHPKLPIVFAGNRKMANAWTAQWFAAVAADEQAGAPLVLKEALARYEATPVEDGLDERIRAAALRTLADGFAFANVTAAFPDAPPARVRRVLGTLRDAGSLTTTGRARGVRYWRR